MLVSSAGDLHNESDLKRKSDSDHDVNFKRLVENLLDFPLHVN